MIETLTVVSILIIIGTGAMISIQRTQNMGLVNRSAREVISQLKRAQTLAISGENSTGILPYHYGIMFDSNNKQRYVLFADQDDTAALDSYTVPDADQNTDDQVEVFKLSVNKVEFDIAGDQNVAFSAPNGRMSNPAGANFEIIIQRTDASESKTVVVDFVSGLIYEQ